MKKGLAALIIVLVTVFALAAAAVLAWVILVKVPYEEPEATEEITEETSEESTTTEITWQDSYIYWAQERPSTNQSTYPIQRMNGDGTEQKQVFTNVAALDSPEGVAISPDGENLAYACVSGVFDLCLKKSDATGLLSPKLKGVPHQISWSHDGQKLVMSVLEGTDDGAKNILATTDTSGGDYQTVIAEDNLPGEVFYPSYFPEDKKILFQAKKDDDRDIYTVNSDGTEVTAIIAGDDKEYEPALSADGKKIAYTVTKDEAEQIWLAQADGGNKKQLTTEGNNKSPRFSPDGEKIAFTSNRDGGQTWEIYIMNTDGSEQKRLTNNKLNDSAPRWSQYKIEGLGIDFSSYTEVLDAYLVGRMKGDSETVKQLVAEGLQDDAAGITSSMAGTFGRYEFVREATISQSEKKVDIKLHYNDDTKGSEERTYTLNLYESTKWLISTEEVKKEEEETTTDEIKTGAVEHKMADLEAMQKSVDEGSQPWRLDPYMVAISDGVELGFNQAEDSFTLTSKIESGEYSGAGEATVEAKHKDVTYIVQLMQPVDQGDKGIWVINSVAKKE
ncbi:MAG: PD40 domain-containing protein [Parcubacteria group bacterium]|nr:PD40 domain-containing protein [Parcubacteria group bacterium]